MHVSIKHFPGQYPSFNIALHNAEGAEPFLEVKGCRIVSGSNGPFVSYPSRKDEKTGKYWSHVYGGEKFNAHVLKLAQVEAPKPKQAASDMDEIPFADPLKSRAACLAC